MGVPRREWSAGGLPPARGRDSGDWQPCERCLRPEACGSEGRPRAGPVGGRARAPRARRPPLRATQKASAGAGAGAGAGAVAGPVAARGAGRAWALRNGQWSRSRRDGGAAGDLGTLRLGI